MTFMSKWIIFQVKTWKVDLQIDESFYHFYPINSKVYDQRSTYFDMSILGKEK